jgi:uncharacterized cupredoxin-like copper-binding protein
MRLPSLVLGMLVGALTLVGCSAAPAETTVVMTDFAFEPKQLTMQPGQRVTLLLQNKGTTEHNLTIPELRVDSGNVAPGQSARVEVAGPARVYKLLCAITGHEEQGMVGELRIQRR